MQPNFSTLVIIQAMIMIESQILIVAQKGIIKVSIHQRRKWHVLGRIRGIYGTLQHECENETIFETWRMCGRNLERHTNWPKLMQLWQKFILIPSSIVICERGFSKQNAIKTYLHNRLNLKTLDALMHVSLCGLDVDAMDWATIFNNWRNMRDGRILTLNW